MKTFILLLALFSSRTFAQGNYLMKQVWENLLMVHWSVSPEELRSHIPSEFEILTHGGKAYVGAVALDMETEAIVRGGIFSRIPLYRSFGQLNFRTYVSYKGKKGVYFFNLFAENRPTILVANQVFGLPYVYKRVHRSYQKDELEFEVPGVFKARAEIESPEKVYPKGSLEHFLTDNAYYFQMKDNCVYSGKLWHEEWKLARA